MSQTRIEYRMYRDNLYIRAFQSVASEQFGDNFGTVTVTDAQFKTFMRAVAKRAGTTTRAVSMRLRKLHYTD